ncbi:MAG: class I SAM-dependent methyltransferase [Deltaproteobacteria bacterium]|jgi:hypothetical protein|nr:class I SAM-dependent methyltransferase [Deltaproteobacteria bacterium]MBT4091380.1 class I SAM-dependent methyltransferase [Deltaproteobacteria bacterium]MBT4269268.1 class I SAM-dependent methyltransferase [Deltaproteobacteria bacterium]MBT4639217.1 class I SAM-dependent methyltransferase [Deltaproteobacteria bacterium]MBT6500125.1 class I SAM-dependent methyltransferase [Deltaproteobacteria bacterium]
MTPQSCVLCSHHQIDPYFQDRTRSYFLCLHCGFIFVPACYHVSVQREKARYDTHQNSADDEGYRQFLSQIVPPLLSKIGSEDNGLDYGCGPAPVLAQMLNNRGYKTDYHDPFYHPDAALLAKQYDFVTCTEVVEHFRDPAIEWKRLINLVKKGGWLAVMTQLTFAGMDFGHWYYKNDETHISFYAGQTFNWLSRQYDLSLEHHSQSIVLLQC